MIIDISNASLINSKEVYIHDDIMDEFNFHREEKELYVSVLKSEEYTKSVLITFKNVIGFSMTSCDFWGSSCQILDFEYIKEDRSMLIPLLFKRLDSECETHCPIGDKAKYFESRITFVSGDYLTIVCEKIIIE